MSGIVSRAGQWLVDAAQGVGMLALEAALRGAPEPKGYRWEWVVGGLLRSRFFRREILDNLKAALGNPDWPESKWQALLADHRRWAGHLAIEVLYWLGLSADEIRTRVSASGEEHVVEALRSGRGLFLFASHTGNPFSILARLGEWSANVCILGHAMPAAALERRMASLHREFGISRWLVSRGETPPVQETLRRNGIVVIFVDLTTVEKHNVWVRFGHGEMLVNLGPAFLALRHDVPALCMTCASLGGGRHRVDVHPLPPRSRSGSLARDALRLTQQAVEVVATQVLRDPARWWLLYGASIRRVQSAG